MISLAAYLGYMFHFALLSCQFDSRPLKKIQFFRSFSFEVFNFKIYLWKRKFKFDISIQVVRLVVFGTR